MKTKVGFTGASFFAFHGYYAEERKSGSHFLIDCEVVLSNFDSLDDDISDTLNYEQLYNITKNEMHQTHKLLETVVLRILNEIKLQFPFVNNAKVRLEKLGPQLGGKVEKTIVEMSF